MRLALLPLLVSALAGCSRSCENAVVSRADSPGGDFSVVLFQRDCGATAGFSTQVSVLKAGQQLSESGNAFRADDNHGAASTGEWGGPWAEFRWLAPDHLLIRYAEHASVFEKARTVSGVQITYEAVNR